MNSVWQCLAQLPRFLQCLPSAGGSIPGTLSALLHGIQAGRDCSALLLRTIDAVGRVKQKFHRPAGPRRSSVWRQEDAQEYLTQLLDCLPPASQAPLLGELCSRVWSEGCRSRSAKKEGFLCLSLALPSSRRATTLHDCLQSFFNPEDTGRWSGCVCGAPHEAARQQLSVSVWPSVLCLHLKRFSYRDTGGAKKLRQLVTAPHVLAGAALPPDMPPYRLCGVVNHSGESMETGHYTAFVRHAVSGRWFACDDGSVRAAHEADVVTAEAYILFYCVDGTGPKGT